MGFFTPKTSQKRVKNESKNESKIDAKTDSLFSPQNSSKSMINKRNSGKMCGQN